MYLCNEFDVGERRVRLAALCHQLAEQHAKRPDVGVCGKLVVENRLGSCPLYGHLVCVVGQAVGGLVVNLGVADPSHAETTDLNHHVVADRDVAGSHAAMDAVLLLQVSHGGRDLQAQRGMIRNLKKVEAPRAPPVQCGSYKLRWFFSSWCRYMCVCMQVRVCASICACVCVCMSQ